jgi:hypothetical protein
MVWPDGQVQVTVQAVIAELPAVTVTVLWKPPVQLLSMCQLAEQVLDPPVAGGVGLAVRGGVAVAGGVGLAVRGGVAVAGGVGLAVRGGVAVAGGVGLAVRGGVAVAGGGVAPPAAVQLRAGVTALPFICMPKVVLPPAPRAPL